MDSQNISHTFCIIRLQHELNHLHCNSGHGISFSRKGSSLRRVTLGYSCTDSLSVPLRMFRNRRTSLIHGWLGASMSERIADPGLTTFHHDNLSAD